jgi:hypothetical protein
MDYGTVGRSPSFAKALRAAGRGETQNANAPAWKARRPLQRPRRGARRRGHVKSAAMGGITARRNAECKCARLEGEAAATKAKARDRAMRSRQIRGDGRNYGAEERDELAFHAVAGFHYLGVGQRLIQDSGGHVRHA